MVLLPYLLYTISPILSCTPNAAGIWRLISNKYGIAYLLSQYTFTSMAEALLIYSDSQTVVKQVLHEWSINGDRLHNFAMNAWELSKGKNVRFEWIPSKSNKAGKMMGS